MVFGLFKSKRKTYVASSVYNMGGDHEDRPNMLRTTIASAILTGNPKDSLGDKMMEMNLKGPSFQQSSWYRWSATNYPEGQVSAGFSHSPAIDTAKYDQIATVVPVPPNHVAKVKDVFLDYANIDYWAERHILDTRPEDYALAWETEYNQSTNTIRILYPNGSDEIVSVPDFDVGIEEYAYIRYNSKKPDFDLAWENGVKVDTYSYDAGITDSLGAWNVLSDTSGSETVETNSSVRVIVSKAGAILSDTTTQTPEQTVFDTRVQVFKRVIDLGADVNSPRFVVERQRLTKTRSYIVDIYEESTNSVDVETGYETSVISRIEVPRAVWTVSRDAQIGYVEDYSGPSKLMIYAIGSGNVVLDSLKTSGSSISGFYPVLPVRIRKNFVENESVERAYKKAHDTTVEKLRESIEDNEDLNDIDHIFMVFGVEANAYDTGSKRYMYEFMKLLQGEQGSSNITFQNYLEKKAIQIDDLEAEEEWSKDQLLGIFSPTFGTERPSEMVSRDIRPPVPSNSSIIVKTTNRQTVDSPYEIRLQWAHIGEIQQDGLGKQSAKVGDMWFAVQKDLEAGNAIKTSEGFIQLASRNSKINHVRLYWQYAKDKHRYLDIYGLVHRNMVHNGQAEVTTLAESIEAQGSDDNEGFFFPLHEGTMRKLPLQIRHQLTVSNRLLVLNAYQVVKQKWYQTGIFKVLFFIAVIVVSVFFFPGAAGLLGTNAMVGASLGFAVGSLTALIMGAIANAIASVVVSQIIQMGATALFGDELGALLGAIIGFFTFQFASTGSISMINFMDPMNLLKLTNAVVSGITDWAGAKMEGIADDLQTGQDDYNDEMQHIKKQMMDILGDGGAVINPLLFTQDMGANGFASESRSAFLYRTLDFDVIKAQSELISDFVDLSLILEGPKTLFSE